MVRSLLLLIALLNLPALGRAQMPVPMSEVARIQTVISLQVEAFRAGDLERAFSFAAPSIQKTFGDSQAFGRMVEQGYGQIFSAFDFSFIGTLGTQDAPIQLVRFTGTDLTAVMAFYFMELQSGGQWRIAGVQLSTVPDQVL